MKIILIMLFYSCNKISIKNMKKGADDFLITAIYNKDLDFIKSYLKDKDENEPDMRNLILNIGAKTGNIDIVKFIISGSATLMKSEHNISRPLLNPYIKDEKGRYPVELAKDENVRKVIINYTYEFELFEILKSEDKDLKKASLLFDKIEKVRRLPWILKTYLELFIKNNYKSKKYETKLEKLLENIQKKVDNFFELSSIILSGLEVHNKDLKSSNNMLLDFHSKMYRTFRIDDEDNRRFIRNINSLRHELLYCIDVKEYREDILEIFRHQAFIEIFGTYTLGKGWSNGNKLISYNLLKEMSYYESKSNSDEDLDL